MSPPSLCGGALNSRRGLLASLWSIVVALTFLAFIVALIFTLSATSSGNDENNYYNNENEHEENRDENAESEMAVTSRAMAFCALWTAVLAALMAIFGAVILGWQSPTGVYYTCCSPQVHRTTPLALGSFIGALIMFANLTLVCSVLFGEFDVRVKVTVVPNHVTKILRVLITILCPLCYALPPIDTRLQRRRRRR